MDLKVTIKNLGKLTDANIRISKFTVFAGVNGTGKGFASKALYSRLSSSLDDSHILYRLERHAYRLQGCVKMLKSEGFDDEEFFSLLQHLDKFNEIISEIKGVDARDKIPAFEQKISDILNTCKSIGSVSANMMDKIKSHDLNYQEGEGRAFDFAAFKESSDFFEIMTEDKIRKSYAADIKNMFEGNFLRNFQAEKLSDLKSDKGEKISVKIDTKSLMLEQEEYVKDYLNNENYSNLDILHTFITSRALYMGSPLFWQLKNTLEGAGGPRSFDFQQGLSGVPKYFFDMVDELRRAYIGEPIAADVLDRLTGEYGINGRVSVAATGEMQYAGNNGITVPLGLASAGIVNLGMLALLIEKKILDKNTFLFIDEPESHMHPEWQVEMADALFNLAEAGVNVVVATYSAEILKWVEVHVKENPEAKEMIALNHFREDGSVESSGGDFDERLYAIQKEITMPFYRLFYRGL